MFTQLIGKKCSTGPSCSLSGQSQDLGLVICPECGSDLEPVLVENRRLKAVVAIGLVLLGAASGLFGYGYVARSLGPLRTVRWLLTNDIKFSRSLQPADASAWVDAEAVIYSDSGPVPARREAFLYEVKDGLRTSTLREQLDANTKLSFNIQRGAPGVTTLYFLYRGEDGVRILYPTGQAGSAAPDAVVSVPSKESLFQLAGGAGVEHFVLIAAKKPLPQLDRLAGTADTSKPSIQVATAAADAAVAGIERDPDAYVLHVFVPHM